MLVLGGIDVLAQLVGRLPKLFFQRFFFDGFVSLALGHIGNFLFGCHPAGERRGCRWCSRRSENYRAQGTGKCLLTADAHTTAVRVLPSIVTRQRMSRACCDFARACPLCGQSSRASALLVQALSTDLVRGPSRLLQRTGRRTRSSYQPHSVEIKAPDAAAAPPAAPGCHPRPHRVPAGVRRAAPPPAPS